jgi:hypothetical protein
MRRISDGNLFFGFARRAASAARFALMAGRSKGEKQILRYAQNDKLVVAS